MSFLCPHCGKKCPSSEALNQHLNSQAHNLKCTACNRIFKTPPALQQHMGDSHPKAPSKAPPKAPSHKCVKCNRSFESNQALQQHLASLAHDPALHCSERPSSDRQALQQNLVSPVYPILIYNVYSRPFDGQQTLQHVEHPSAQVPPYNHTNHNYPFNGLQSLQQQTTGSQPYTIPSSSHILPDTAVKVECMPKRPKKSDEIKVGPRRRPSPEKEQKKDKLQDKDERIPRRRRVSV